MSTGEAIANTVGNAILDGVEGYIGGLNPFKKHHPKHKNSTSQENRKRDFQVLLNQAADMPPSIAAEDSDRDKGERSNWRDEQGRGRDQLLLSQPVSLILDRRNEVNEGKAVEGRIRLCNVDPCFLNLKTVADHSTKDPAALAMGIIAIFSLAILALVALRNRRRKPKSTLLGASTSTFEMSQGNWP